MKLLQIEHKIRKCVIECPAILYIKKTIRTVLLIKIQMRGLFTTGFIKSIVFTIPRKYSHVYSTQGCIPTIYETPSALHRL